MISMAVVTLVAVVLVVGVIAVTRRRGGNVDSGAEGHGLSDSAAAAVEDVAGPMFGVNAHPTSPEALKRRIP